SGPAPAGTASSGSPRYGSPAPPATSRVPPAAAPGVRRVVTPPPRPAPPLYDLPYERDYPRYEKPASRGPGARPDARAGTRGGSARPGTGSARPLAPAAPRGRTSWTRLDAAAGVPTRRPRAIPSRGLRPRRRAPPAGGRFRRDPGETCFHGCG